MAPSTGLDPWRRSSVAACLLLTMISVLSVKPAVAQDGAGPSNHPLLFSLGLGESDESSGSVYDVRIPIGYTLIPPDDRPWGLRLRLILYAGIYDFLLDDLVDIDLRFQSLAATPGVEFLVPLGRSWTLKPFTEIGYARDFENALSFGVWSVGMRTLAVWYPGTVELSFGTEIKYLSTFKSDLDLADDYGEIKIGLDAGFPLGFDIAGNTAYLSTYGIRTQYIDAVISRPEGTPLEINFHNEIGVAFGTRPKIKLWFIKLPRIGIGYRWGPNVNGYRLSFGFPF
jgi:hypothetical protein